MLAFPRKWVKNKEEEGILPQRGAGYFNLKVGRKQCVYFFLSDFRHGFQCMYLSGIYSVVLVLIKLKKGRISASIWNTNYWNSCFNGGQPSHPPSIASSGNTTPTSIAKHFLSVLLTTQGVLCYSGALQMRFLLDMIGWVNWRISMKPLYRVLKKWPDVTVDSLPNTSSLAHIPASSEPLTSSGLSLSHLSHLSPSTTVKHSFSAPQVCKPQNPLTRNWRKVLEYLATPRRSSHIFFTIPRHWLPLQPKKFSKRRVLSLMRPPQLGAIRWSSRPSVQQFQRRFD